MPHSESIDKLVKPYKPSAPLGLVFGLGLLAIQACFPPCLQAQATISTGSIQGTVTDPSGAVIPNASITITEQATGQVLHLTTTVAGTYSAGAIIPGDYQIRVEAEGFAPTELPVVVRVGGIAMAVVQLRIGEEKTVLQVKATPVAVNSVQATVQGVLTTNQIDQLPINGRNFLDLAQLEPGVQIQDGSTFDPTKNGFASISFGGRFGRTARIEVDGVDISDEMVGTTTENIPAGAIQEFQIAQSSLDLSTELTSSGAVNVLTRSGTNQYHGQAFFYGRWHTTAARIAPTDLFFQRQQFGASLGGPIKHDKLFFFTDWADNRQDLAAPVQLGSPFQALSGSNNQPFREQLVLARLDWQVKTNARAFYRFAYNMNSSVVPLLPNTFQPFLTSNHTQSHAVGFDLTTGTYSHSFRFGFLRFANEITNSVGAAAYNPAPNIELSIGADPLCATPGANVLCSGISFFAPQVAQQHDHQLKYDGSKIFGAHVLRYGVGINWILALGLAKFLGLAPAVNNIFGAADQAFAATGPFAGGVSNPLNYPVSVVYLGNGQGYNTEIPRFGFPAGGQYDTRFSWYVGDTWKAKSNLNLTFGIRYVRDTGRSDADLPPIPAIDLFGPGLGQRVNQPNWNFAPQLGLAWDPWHNGKTAIRAGAGVFYENSLFNNILFDRPARLQTGLFFGLQRVCPGATGSLVLPDGQVVDVTKLCGTAASPVAIGSVADQIAALQQQYQAAVAAAGPQVNASYVGNVLADNRGIGTNLLAPNYQSPYSLQMNVGFQRQLRPGTVLTVDYLRNIGMRYLLYYDTNHVGDARYLNKAAALHAINLTNESFKCPDGPAGVNCAISAGATIATYAENGLDSGAVVFGGLPAAIAGIPGFNNTPDTGAAFPGIDPNVGQNMMLFPIGRSVYNGLAISFRQDAQHPLPHVNHMNLQASYTLSRFKSLVADQDFINGATDNNNINHYFGPNALDRTQQFSAGAVFDLPHALSLSMIAHVDSSLPVTLTVPPGPQREPSGAQIFQSDLTGDGTTGDVLPGTNIGSFGRDVTPGNINAVISQYNSSVAGQLTPAGQALVNAGLFTGDQLKALGAVAPTLALAPPGQVGVGSLFTIDLRLSWALRLGEHVRLVPSVAVFNLTNSQNYDFANNILSGILQAAPPPGAAVPSGSANSTTYPQRTTRVTLGSGVYALGAPRVFEWGAQIVW